MDDGGDLRVGVTLGVRGHDVLVGGLAQQVAVFAHFDQFTLKNYVLEPAALNQQFGPMMGYLLKGIEQRLAKQPAYRLDAKNADQAWLKNHVTSVELQPGVLRLKTRS